MSADTAARGIHTDATASNADYEWNAFDSEAYFQHYYGEPHPDDDLVIRHAVAAIRRLAAPGSGLDVVDVGTGPNLIPFFCALPEARSLTAWEYAASNVAWLEAELQKSDLRPQWQHFWRVTREAYGSTAAVPDDPIPSLRAKVRVAQGSIFDLPRHRWDLATMFFCAESITGRMDEFEHACRAFAGAVKPGGALVAAFLVRSGGYEVAGRQFPVLHLSAETIERVFREVADHVAAEHIGIVEREIRSGYAGFVLLTGVAR